MDEMLKTVDVIKSVCGDTLEPDSNLMFEASLDGVAPNYLDFYAENGICVVIPINERIFLENYFETINVSRTIKIPQPQGNIQAKHPDEIKLEVSFLPHNKEMFKSMLAEAIEYLNSAI